MKLETTTKESRREWFNAARRILVSHFRGLRPGEDPFPTWRGEEIGTMNDVYQIVLGVGLSAGKSLGKRMNPSAAQIALIREFMPDIDEKIRTMRDKPAALEMIEQKEYYEKIIAERDRKIEELEKKVAWQEKQIATLIGTIGKMQGNGGS